MSTSPTQRTLKYLRAKGHTCAISEHWNPFAKIRQDLFGFCDIVSLTEDGDTICVQACSGTDTSKREKKILAHKNYPLLKRSNWKILVIGWRKLKVKRGGKAIKWVEKVSEL